MTQERKTTQSQKNTITRLDISEGIYRKLGRPRAESIQLLESVLDIITDRVVKGETVKLSSFGSFNVRHKKERIGRNPKTKVAAVITPRNVLTFQPSQIMRNRINKK